MDGVQHCCLFFGLIQTAIKDEVSMSLTSALRLCRVRFRDTERAPLSPYRLMFRRQHVEQHKEKLGWNNTSVQPTTRASLLHEKIQSSSMFFPQILKK